MGHEGFTGTSALLYHVHPPTTVKSVRRVKETAFEADPDHALRHRHFLTSHAKKGGSPTLDRIPLLFNQDIAMLYVEPDKQDEHFYRNAQSDELVYVAKGKGVLESVFGELPFGEGDYLVIHRGILHRYRVRRERRPAEAARVREPRTRALAQAVPQRVRPAERRRAVLRARHPSAAEAQHARRDGRLPAAREAVRRHQRADSRSPSVRRRRVGWLLLSLGVQHPRLRADRRARPPAAAGAPDVRGRRLRRLLVLPAAVRLRSERGARAVQSQQRRLRRSACTTRRASS